MADKLTAIERSVNMGRIKSKNTSPEISVRRAVYSMGYRYRLHRKDLPGKPDLVFGPRKKVIFVHGCFWHQHTGCNEGRIPKTRTDYWLPKLSRNVSRDKEAVQQLQRIGWSVLIIWECEIKATMFRERLRTFLND